MDFSLSETQRHWQGRVRDFMDREVVPAVPVYEAEMRAFGADRWQNPKIVETLKDKARAAGLWNLFLPPSPDHDKPQICWEWMVIRASSVIAPFQPKIALSVSDGHSML